MAAPLQYFRFHKVEPVNSPDIDENGPEPRSGHRIISDEGNLYSIGGYNPDFWEVPNDDDNTYYPLFKELWKFNYATRKWTKLNTYGGMPLELASHSAMLDGQNLLVFGGTGVPFGEAASNQLHVCNLRRLQWKHIKCTGEFPIRCYGHTMMLMNRQLYIYGGTTGWEYNSELHRLNLETNSWEEIKTSGESPDGRYRHEVATDDRNFYVFGGGRATQVYSFEQIPTYDFEEKKWGKAACTADRAHGFPGPRRCHTCVQLDRSVYICGGYDGENIFDDLWKFNLENLQWTLLPARLPVPLYFHAAAVTNSGCMVIFGGVTKIDVERTSQVLIVWLKVPPLRELCWHQISKRIPNIDSISHHRLVEIGIPAGLVERLP